MFKSVLEKQKQQQQQNERDTSAPTSDAISLTTREKSLAGVRFNVALGPQKTTGLIRDGEPRTATSTFTQLLSSELARVCCFGL